MQSLAKENNRLGEVSCQREHSVSQRGSVAAMNSSAICYKSASDCAGSQGMQLQNRPSA